MKFESVRLLHAQGAPDHYIANQVYQPIDEDHRQYGSFAILFDNAGNPDGAFVASLVNTLIREYYRNYTPDRLTCFEQTLVRVNDQIKQFTATSESTSPLILNGAIVLFVNDEIHITHIGQPRAFLLRQREVISLIESADDDGGSLHTFSLITSGEVHENDILVLLSSLSNEDSIKEDLHFAVSHTPLHESGRAYARILKQKFERATEAIFLRFTTEEESMYQVYLDRPLETRSEKMEHYRKQVTKHASYIVHGLGALGGKLRRKPAQRTPTKNESIQTTEAKKGEEAIQSDLPVEDLHDETPISIEPETPSFQVRMYRESVSPKRLEATEVVTSDYKLPRSDTIKKLRFIKPRTLYLLIGSLILIAIVIRIVNATNLGKSSVQQTTVNREAIIAQVESAEREADAARIQNDSQTAITRLLAASELLGQIPESLQNEQSKTLVTRVRKSLDSLTNTVYLSPQSEQKVSSPSQKVVLTQGGTFITFQDGSVEKITGDEKISIKDLPPGLQITDSVSHNNGELVAVMGITSQQTRVLYTINTGSNEVKQPSREDGKDWPETRLLASFEKNLYFLDQSLFKAMPRGEKYRVIPYASNTTTEAITSVVVNSGFFYGIEHKNALIRLDAKGPKTSVKFYGVPEAFMPKVINRIFSSGKEGVLYLLDTDGHRVIEASTDGAYRKQYILPSEASIRDCDANQSSFSCVSDTNYVTFSLN